MADVRITDLNEELVPTLNTKIAYHGSRVWFGMLPKSTRDSVDRMVREVEERINIKQ